MSHESAKMGTSEMGTACEASLAPNYQYWREHGEEWAEEYDARKLRQPRYHIHEIMLADYFSRCAPARVLEFGCGPGRHLRYLRRIPGIKVHGYDQSATMVSGCLRWATREWLEEHIVVGTPTGRLPYADGEFDIIFTSEVLLHVRAEDLTGVLAELVRVARGHILHLETAPTHPLTECEHQGCWHHDLIGAYAALGHACEMLPGGCASHTPFRVALGDRGPDPAWNPIVLELLMRMERDLVRGLTETELALRDAERRNADATALVAKVREERAALEGEMAALREQLRDRENALNLALDHAEDLERTLAKVRNDREAAVAALREEVGAWQAWARDLEGQVACCKARIDEVEGFAREMIRRLEDVTGLREDWFAGA
jgi:SAM-dependent methyltransferase